VQADLSVQCNTTCVACSGAIYEHGVVALKPRVALEPRAAVLCACDRLDRAGDKDTDDNMRQRARAVGRATGEPEQERVVAGHARGGGGRAWRQPPSQL
jgi:hypothetical protein